MYRKDQNPPQRFPEGMTIESDAGSWAVARVKSRNDKAVALDLIDLGIGYYLPMFEKRVRRRDNNKIRKSLCPLFPGYLSVAAAGEAQVKVLALQGAADIIAVDDQGEFVRELKQVQKLLDMNADMEMLPTLVPGKEVAVRSGPFAGFEGVVVASQGRAKLVISVNMFSRAVAVTVDPADIEPA